MRFQNQDMSCRANDKIMTTETFMPSAGLVQFMSNHGIGWGELLVDQGVCMDYSAASGTCDIQTYLKTNNRIQIDGLRELCVDRRLFVSLEDIQLAAPILPGTIFGVGRNFKGMGEKGNTPVLFLKAVQSVTGTGTDIILPSFLDEVFGEVELGVVMGEQNEIFGYTVVNDVTGRGIDCEDIWFYRKSLSTFTPLGPWIVTADELKDAGNLGVSLSINNKTVMESNTSDMLFTAEEIVRIVARNVKIMPGDLIMMGCPGVCDPLNPGDVVTAEIEHIGVLTNTVSRREER